MNTFHYLPKDKIAEIPKVPGVYAFKGPRGVLYIGKAGNLRGRVKNHFGQPTYRDDLFLDQTTHVGYIELASEIEALLLESQLIKKYDPRYNVVLRDDKQYFYVGFPSAKLRTGPSASSGQAQEKLPRLIITHQPKNNIRYLGPFTDGKSLKTVLRYLRKAFPYYTTTHRKLPCSYCHIGLCPGPDPDIGEYKKDITKIKAVLAGKKPRVISSLKKEMAQFAKNLEFEKAAKARNQITALENIFSHRAKGESLLLLSGEGENEAKKQIAKTLFLDNIESIEAYDISNIQGREPVASMVRFSAPSPRLMSPGLKGGELKPDKSMYRRFKIRLPEKPDDFAMMREVIRRRLAHTEWPYPDIFLIDGGKGQLNAALSQATPDLKIVALAKRFNELYVPGEKKPIPLSQLPRETKNLLMYARDEAHRFAVSYHRKLHRKKTISN